VQQYFRSSSLKAWMKCCSAGSTVPFFGLAVMEELSGIRTGVAFQLKAVFHPDAVMSRYLAEQLLIGSPEPFYDAVQNASADTSGDRYLAKNTSVDVTGQVASVTLEEQRVPWPAGHELLPSAERRRPLADTEQDLYVGMTASRREGPVPQHQLDITQAQSNTTRAADGGERYARRGQVASARNRATSSVPIGDGWPP
jgi:Putative lumazine-binding